MLGVVVRVGVLTPGLAVTASVAVGELSGGVAVSVAEIAVGVGGPCSNSNCSAMTSTTETSPSPLTSAPPHGSAPPKTTSMIASRSATSTD